MEINKEDNIYIEIDCQNFSKYHILPNSSRACMETTPRESLAPLIAKVARIFSKSKQRACFDYGWV